MSHNLTIRAAVLATLAFGLAAGTSPTALAAPAAIRLTPESGPPTAVTTVSGSGFKGREIVAIYVDRRRVGSTVANLRGRILKKVVFGPRARPGDHILAARGLTSLRSAIAHFVVRTDWSQSCFDARHSCFNPYENRIGRTQAAELGARWRAAVGATGSASPIYYGGVLLVGTTGGVVGLNPATGEIIIHYRTASPVFTTPVVMRGFDPQPDPPGRLIVASKDGTLSAFDIASGRLVWHSSLGAEPTAPLVVRGFDSTDDKVIVGAGNVLTAFDAKGTATWETRLEGGDISRAGAVMIDQTNELVAVPAGNKLYALDAATGAVAWSATPSRSALGAVSIGDPSIIGDPHILVGDRSGTLYSIDRNTGATAATFKGAGPITGSPAIGNPNIIGDPHPLPWLFVGDGGGNIYGFDQTDEFPPPVWQAALGGSIDGPPVLANGVLYVTTGRLTRDPPHLVALDATTGRRLFDARLAAAAGTPMVADGMVVIGIATGHVVAYDGPDS